ncbi:MAG: nitroreductase family deazaflavin-dependent oxidoreductase [Gammaproteobacteria bacterium]|jgi:hypothetical protein|nr:nitroreductase family deazaflavin-dependent oxidoreductase [Gammaproteobacteria bacterium]MBT4494140.1 nitroreductase family deazaflavin-dependent oxidoreductase [Gammaproteobacteria bacterium]MBT7372187.1 nitroreductase family deazaflavin-dependent oxidoreductase [Gammaproteobacteria bacterium]
MKVPEPLFKIINIFMSLLLKSPLHGIASGSMMIINFTGRKSGRHYSTPVRYLNIDDRIRCTTSKHTKWWRNLVSNQSAALLLGGDLKTCSVEVLMDDDERVRAALVSFLESFPQDAVYQNIRLEADGSLNQLDLEASIREAVIVDFAPIHST